MKKNPVALVQILRERGIKLRDPESELFSATWKIYGGEFSTYHIFPVWENAWRLAEKYPNADKLVVSLGAELHDIGRFQVPGVLGLNENHHIIGAQMAEDLLEDHGFSDNPVLIKNVCHCVLTHRGSKGPAPETIEAKIVACADAMAHFDCPLYVFSSFMIRGNCTFEEAVKGMKEKMRRDWAKLVLPETQEMSREKFRAIMDMLERSKNPFR